MTKIEIEEYLIDLENILINRVEEHKVCFSKKLLQSFPNKPAVYIFREDNEICYIGETYSLRACMFYFLYRKNHTFIKNVVDAYSSNCDNYIESNSKQSFSIYKDELLKKIFKSDFTLSYIEVSLGRKELEDRLLDKYKPKYVTKCKHKTKKSDIYCEERKLYSNAYKPWTLEQDSALELQFCEGKTVKELSDLFERNEGAICSRIRKLELKDKYSF